MCHKRKLFRVDRQTNDYLLVLLSMLWDGDMYEAILTYDLNMRENIDFFSSSSWAQHSPHNPRYTVDYASFDAITIISYRN